MSKNNRPQAIQPKPEFDPRPGAVNAQGVGAPGVDLAKGKDETAFGFIGGNHGALLALLLDATEDAMAVHADVLERLNEALLGPVPRKATIAQLQKAADAARDLVAHLCAAAVSTVGATRKRAA